MMQMRTTKPEQLNLAFADSPHERVLAEIAKESKGNCLWTLA